MPSSFVESRINQNLEVATEYFKALVSENVKSTTDKIKQQSAGSIGFIPYNISFTMDGLGGIKIYNELALDTSFLPAGYTNTTEFIVTGVNHKIQNGDWETDITATLIPRTSPITNVITGSVQIFGQVETAPIIPPTQTPVNVGGPGLEPIKQLIVSVESGGDYEIYNFGASGGSGIRTVTPGSSYNSASAIKLTDKTVGYINSKFQRQQNNYQGKACNPGASGDAFAVGKYQLIPCTLSSAMKSLGLENQPYDAVNQEKIGDWLLLTARPRLGAYLKGANNGSQSDLENAVQDLGQEFASLPIITKNGATEGNVVSGTGKTTYYGGQGPNKSSSKYDVATVVKAIIKSRIQYSSKNPIFLPSYYS
jgi:hypothetical protein